MQYRLTLDIPLTSPVESGFTYTRHCSDFSPGFIASSGTYRCPVTGVVMLQPSTHTDGWKSNLQSLTQFQVQNNYPYWATAKRESLTQFFTNSYNPANPKLIDILVGAAGLTVLNTADANDKMVWAAQSTYLMAADESFTIHYNSIVDHFTRKNNWFAVQWDNIGVHFNQSGLCRVYKYDRSNMAAAPVQTDEFQIAAPSELHGKDGYFWFMPIPTLGLVIQHSSTPQLSSIHSSSSQQSTSRGHLIPWDSISVGTDPQHQYYSLFQASPLALAIHPDYYFMFGIERVTFAPSGTYLDAPFAPSYKPTGTPLLTAVPLSSLKNTITASLFNQAGAGAWVSGTDISGRVSSTLTTDDTKYTPFLFWHQVVFTPNLITRTTVPYQITSQSVAGVGRITGLEYTEDELNNFEGTVELDVTDPNIIKIAERGDSTFLLESSSDKGVSWQIVNGGLAKNWINSYKSDLGGLLLQTSFSIHDMREQLREMRSIQAGALDGKTLSQAINSLLTAAGFAPLGTLPAGVKTILDKTTIPFPTDGKGSRFDCRRGEDASEYLETLLLFLRAQNVEYRMRFDWPTFTWVIEKKPRNVNNYWTLSPSSADVNVGQRVWRYKSAKFEIEPPEGNSVMIVGGSTRGETAIPTQGDFVNVHVGPMVNSKSIYDITSSDYLGRIKSVVFDVYPLADTGELKKMLARLFAVVSVHHGMVRNCELQAAQPLITPATRVVVQKKSGVGVIDGWVKRRTTKFLASTINDNALMSMSLEIDTVWEGSIPRS